MRPENLPENYFALEDPEDTSFRKANRTVLVRETPAPQSHPKLTSIYSAGLPIGEPSMELGLLVAVRIMGP